MRGKWTSQEICVPYRTEALFEICSLNRNVPFKITAFLLCNIVVIFIRCAMIIHSFRVCMVLVSGKNKTSLKK